MRAAKTKGHFLLAGKWTTNHTELQLWLLEALLAASSADEIEVQQLLRLPESFPFTLGIGLGELRKYPRFSIHRQGLDMDMVAWRAETRQAQPKPKKRKTPKDKKLIPAQPTLFDSQQFDAVLGNGKPLSHDEKPLATPKPESISTGGISTDRQPEQPSLKEPSSGRILDTPGENVAEVESREITLENPFVAQVQECTTLLRDGYYYGCIALSQTAL